MNRSLTLFFFFDDEEAFFDDDEVFFDDNEAFFDDEDDPDDTDEFVDDIIAAFSFFVTGERLFWGVGNA